jgi:hypothetical protein
MKPLSIAIMNIDTYIKENNILEVTSPFIRESSSTNLHPDGLFSERIFGEIASPGRLITFGYIDLHTKIIPPRLFRTILKLKGLYEEILTGKAHAVFDPIAKDFLKAKLGDEQAKTGYSFFVKHLPDIEYKSTGSITRDTKIKVLEQYKDRLFMSKYLVLPAGLRDISDVGGRSSTEEINKLYGSLLRLSKVMPIDGSDNPIYDNVRMSIQRKAFEIYEYIKNIVEGKTGFFQKKYGARNIALGTRNVISASDTNAMSPTHPQAIKANETMVPLFQAMKMFQPLVVYQLRTVFLNQILEEGAAQISAIDPATNKLQYISVDISEKDKFMTSEGLVNFINSYRDTSTRHDPVTVTDEQGKEYYLYQTYREGSNFYLIRSAHDLKTLLERKGQHYDNKHLRPLTRAELFYMATYLATMNKHCTVTRYPITGSESDVPSIVHLVSTDRSETLTLRLAANDEVYMPFPHFPVYGESSVDSTVLHPSFLAGLGGDKLILCRP